MSHRLGRRRALALGMGALGSLAAPRWVSASPKDWTTIRHRHFVDGVERSASPRLLADMSNLMRKTAKACVVDTGGWTVPSPIYGDMYARDAFWIAMALAERQLSQEIVGQFRDDQLKNDDGHAATFLSHVLGKTKDTNRVDESTVIFILHNYLLFQLGGQVDRGALGHAYRYLVGQTHDGWFVTRGETRPPAWPTNLEDRGCFHYWADTYRPAGKPEPKAEVFAYNQGMLAVALRCLEAMQVGVDEHIVRRVEHVYASMTSTHDYASLPQRSGAPILDVSGLVGEALSLYWFNRSLLGPQRVTATMGSLNKVHHWDGEFLGFRVISNPDGSCRPDDEFIVPISNPPGYYHNGGSWLLYDALALYAGGRHGVEGTHDLFAKRLASELRYDRESHEYLSTSVDQLGKGEPRRFGYGWNAFVWRLYSLG